MSINTVLFDFDGTVANTNNIVVNSWQEVYKFVRGHEENTEEIYKTFGEPLDISMKKIFPDENIDELIKIYRGYQVDRFTEMIELFPGMKQLMVDLKAKGYNVAIVTSRLRNTTMQGLEKFGLLDVVDYIVTCEDTPKHKPDPEPVNIALRHYEISPDEAIMIGDSMFDIQCAHNAGVRAVLVNWALAVSDEDLNGPDGPEYVIEKANDLFLHI